MHAGDASATLLNAVYHLNLTIIVGIHTQSSAEYLCSNDMGCEEHSTSIS